MTVKISELAAASLPLPRTALFEVTVLGSPNVSRSVSGESIAALSAIWVTQYGATGDGSTNDTTAVQAALDAAATVVSATGQPCVVHFPAGTYMLDPVYVTASRVTVSGEGRATLLKRRPANVTSLDSLGVLNVHGSSGSRLADVVICDLAVDGSKGDITVSGGASLIDSECISCIYTDRIRVERCWTYNSPGDGYDFDESADGRVIADYGEGHDGYAVHFSTNCTRMHANGCVAYNCGTVHTRGGFDTHFSSTECTYTDCHARSCYRGFMVEGEGSNLSNCTANACAVNGFRLVGNYNSMGNCRVNGTTGGNGVTVAGDYCVITGGSYVNSAGGGSGITLISGAVNNAVVGAVCRGNAGNGLALASGANTNNITGCIINGNTGTNYSDAGTGNTSTGNRTS